MPLAQMDQFRTRMAAIEAGFGDKREIKRIWSESTLGYDAQLDAVRFSANSRQNVTFETCVTTASPAGHGAEQYH